MKGPFTVPKFRGGLTNKADETPTPIEIILTLLYPDFYCIFTALQTYHKYYSNYKTQKKKKNV